MKFNWQEAGLLFALAFGVAAIVSALYGGLVNGSWQADWGHALRLGIILAVVIPLSRSLAK